MGKKIKVKLSDVERLYPFFCPQLQIYVNYRLKVTRDDAEYAHIDQDFIDYAYIVGRTPEKLRPMFEEVFPSKTKPSFLNRLWMTIKLWKFRKFLNNQCDASLLRPGETMFVKKSRHCCKDNDYIRRTETGAVSLWTGQTWEKDELHKLNGVRKKEGLSFSKNYYL